MNEAVKLINLYMERMPKSTPRYPLAMDTWMDLTICRISDFATSTGKYVKHANQWTVWGDGKLLFATEHVHDGGINVELHINRRLVCVSKQLYANRRGGYTEPADNSVLRDIAMPMGEHISDTAV